MANVELLLADAENLILSALLAPSWGVYQNGTPVIQPASLLTQFVGGFVQPLSQIASLVGLPGIVPAFASTVEFEYAQDWPLSNYPQEQGGFQTYNKVTLPFDVKLRLACQGPQTIRQAFLTTCLAISNSFQLFDVVTPELVFTSCNVSHIGWRREAERGATMIVVDMWFQQIAVTNSTTFQNTQQPGDASPQSLSNVQPLSPNQVVSQGFSAGNWQVQ